MSDIEKAARNLPTDPNYALLMFADAVFKSHAKNHGIKDDDAIFAIRFIEKFAKRFGVRCSLTTTPGGTIAQRVMNLVEQIRKQRSYLAANIVDVSIDDILSKYAGEQDETFGLARLNAEEKQKILRHLESDSK